MNSNPIGSGSNLKKGLAYIATAVVLGTALMLTPIWLFPAKIRYEVAPGQYLSPLAEAAQTMRGLPEKTEALAGIKVNQPIDAISLSLMFTISLVFALGASLYLKKRMSSSVAV